MRRKIFNLIRSTNLEAVIWITALFYLAINYPVGDNHFSICPIKGLGFSFCPGCGLGESISHLFRFKISQSFRCHPLGIFALPILIYRIIFLLNKSYSNFQRDFSQKVGVNNNG
jgi:hypothetical protein